MPQNNANKGDEIDLGQLMLLFRKVSKSIFKSFLRFFVYLKKNSIVIGSLLAVGVVAGFLANFIFEKKLETEVIVKANFESKDYLYDMISEIEANTKSKDTAFFSKIGIAASNIKSFEVLVEPIEEVSKEEDLENDMRYLSLLQNFKEQSFAVEAIRQELSKKSNIRHKLKFRYKDLKIGKENIDKILKYLNANSYFEQVGEVLRENAKKRIEKNSNLIEQIDDLIANYSKGLAAQSKKPSDGGTIYMEKEQSLNVPSLLSLKTVLAKEIEEKRLDLVSTTKIIEIINISSSHEVRKQFFSKNIVFIPSLLLFFFFFFSFIKYLNRKAQEHNLN